MHAWLRNLPRTDKRRNSKSSRQLRANQPQPRAKFECVGLESLEKRVLLAADLAVTKTADVAAPVQGQLIDYTISVQNIGTSAATTSTLSAPLPAGLSLLSASTDTGSVSDSGGTE